MKMFDVVRLSVPVLVTAVALLGAASASTIPLQPGALLQTPEGNNCTVGFMLDEFDEDGEDTGQEWFVTAGHCFVDDGAMTWEPDLGPEVTVRDAVVGRAVYAVKDWALGYDVALVRLTIEDSSVDPSVCYWGGPTHTTSTSPEEGDTLLFSGQGGLLHPREQMATADQELWVQYRGYHGGGDSGAPVMSEDGNALGIHALGGVEIGDVSTGSASKFDEMLHLLEYEFATDFELKTAGLEDVDWPLDSLDEDCAHVLGVP